MSRLSLLAEDNIILDTAPLTYLLLHNLDERSEIDVYGRVDNICNTEFKRENTSLFVEKIADRNIFFTSRTISEASNHAESKYNIPIEKFLEENKTLLSKDLNEGFTDIEIILESLLGLEFGVADCSMNELLDSSREFGLITDDEALITGLSDQEHNAIPFGTLLIEP